MEGMAFGLPFMTVAVAIGVPLFLAALLIWWGITYRSSEGNDTRAGKGGKT